MRLLVAMAVVAVLVWAIPMVFIGHQQARRAETLAVGSSSGSSDAGQGVLSEVGSGPTQAQAPTGPIGRANDVAAQSTLNEALRVAQVYFAENDSYAGLDPTAAAEYEPSIVFTDGAAAPGMVAIRATPTSVVLVTLAYGGGYLCAAANGDVVSLGRANAIAPDQCSGGWG